jgi:hypothetical protein
VNGIQLARELLTWRLAEGAEEGPKYVAREAQKLTVAPLLMVDTVMALVDALMPWNPGPPYVIAGSEDPHFGRFICDIDSAAVDTYGRARIQLGQDGWQIDPHASDLCPDCRSTHYDAGRVGA